MIESLSEETRSRCALVFNQFTRAHPAHPPTVAASLGCPLAATLPVDPRAVGFQVSFGRPCVLDRNSRFGRGVARLAHSQAARLRPRQAVAA
jgi:Flp pilus assembly CpaE family ATPase